MIGIGSTGLLAGSSENRVHVVVTHVGSLGGNVFWTNSGWKVLLVHCDSIIVKLWFGSETIIARYW